MSLKVYTFDNIPKFQKPIFIIGSFESFHLGHYKLLEKARELAKESEKERDIVLVYFEDIENLSKTKNLIFSDAKNRVQEFANLKINFAISLFYSQISHLSAQDFIDKLIANQDDYSFVIGEEFKFGFKRSGNVQFLENHYNKDKVFAQEVVRLKNKQKISTSYLKELIEFGDIDLLNTINMFPYSFSAKFSTIENKIELKKHELLIPLRQGIYAVLVELNNYNYYALMQVNFDTKYFIEFLDFKIKENQNIDARIKVLKAIRFFRNKELESINEQNKLNAKSILLDLNNN
ncbi:FAD synthase [Mycoplasmopsis fermentans]|nr:riboflavin kinase [Mycoplasmopsis fermentans]VEU67493.1 riboflavin kinase [Mesomycoplasma conjunctivae]ADN68907.1 riboflavin kinase [Mycoplasmopsis fermentans JER]ADV34327.1 Riboflavin biosynthesis protein [Mycoplasmopsis fermentans M64]RMX35816.1 FAD synthetase family protein [Mycoplasmopsis fermentans MF-I2]VEU60351.1 riboflavin kinase [Mycoplasmopsis fermentans]